MTITKEHLVFFAVYGTIFLVFASWQLVMGGNEISESLPLVILTLLPLTASNFYLLNLFGIQEVSEKQPRRARIYLGVAIFGALPWLLVVGTNGEIRLYLVPLLIAQYYAFYLIPPVFLIILGTVFGVQIWLWNEKIGASRKRDKKMFLSIGLVWALYLISLPMLAYIASGSPQY